MRIQHTIILASAALFTLTGCGGSSSSSATPTMDPSSVDTIFTTGIDGDPASIPDAATLGAEIDSVFGGKNTEPVSINPGDTIADVLARAKNG